MWFRRPTNWGQAAPAMTSHRFSSIVAGQGKPLARAGLLCGVTRDRRRAVCTGWQSTADFATLSNFWSDWRSCCIVPPNGFFFGRTNTTFAPGDQLIAKLVVSENFACALLDSSQFFCFALG